MTSKESSMLEPTSRPVAAERRPERPRFYRVADAAEIFGMSPVTLYRAIRAGEFPAVRIRGRLIVPAKAVEAMSEAAVATHGVVDAAGWVASPAGGAA